MKTDLRTFAALGALMATTAFATEYEASGRPASEPAEPAWEFAVTAYPTSVRNGEDYTSVTAVADRGPLHLLARVNYESIGSRSVFAGWTFSGGNEVTWEFTPLIGGAWGTIHAFIPAFEASVAWRRLDYYIEAEYVNDNSAGSSSYTYAWTELGFRPVEWLRFGVAGQRTRIYGGERDIQRGPFVQATWRRVTIGGYWFNPGSNEQIFIASIGVAF